MHPREGIFLALSPLLLMAYTYTNWDFFRTGRCSISGYCILLGHCPISWKIVNKLFLDHLIKLCAEPCLKTTCKMQWLKFLLIGSSINSLVPTTMLYANHFVIHIAVISIFMSYLSILKLIVISSMKKLNKA